MTGDKLTGLIAAAGIVGLTLLAIRQGVISDVSDILVLLAVTVAGLLAGYGLWLHREVLPAYKDKGSKA